MNHPIRRRRIIMLLMIVRNAGIVTGASTIILSFIGIENKQDGITRFAILISGMLLIFFCLRTVNGSTNISETH